MAKAELTVLSPVHIGNGITYNKDIHFINQGNKVGIINPEKIADLVQLDTALIDAWVNAIENNEPLSKFLGESRGIKFTLEQISNRILEAKGVANMPTQLKEHYYSPLKGITIPGSSLKGAIRTAVLENLANPDFLKNLQTVDLKNKRNQWSDGTVMGKLFGGDAKVQSTRFLKLGDVHFNDTQSQLREMKILSLGNRGFYPKPGSHLFEIIPQKSRSLSFSFKVDETLLKLNMNKEPEKWRNDKIGYLKEGVIGIARMVDDFSRELLDREIEMLQDEYFDDHELGSGYLEACSAILQTPKKEGEFIIRLGGNSGWLFTTGAWVRKKTPRIPDSVKSEIKKAVQKNKDYPFDLWPKTRKVSTLGEPFGFVKIKLL